MKTQRNVEGLRQNAQKKRQESLDKVDKGIQEMIRTRQKINFNTVAEACGVSKAFLYKEPEIKARIDHLRKQYSDTIKIAPEQRPSESSKDALIKMLKERNRVLSEKVKELEHQNAVVYGKVAQISEIEAENRRLKAQLAGMQSAPTLTVLESNDKVVSIDNVQSAGDRISKDLDELGIKPNSTLNKVIRSAPESVVITAIAALKEAMVAGRIERPGAWLKTAIENQWIPNEALEKQVQAVNTSEPTFREWYDLAKAYGVITAFEEQEGVMMVKEPGIGWHVYEEYVARGWTIEYFRNWKSRRV